MENVNTRSRRSSTVFPTIADNVLQSDYTREIDNLLKLKRDTKLLKSKRLEMDSAYTSKIFSASSTPALLSTAAVSPEPTLLLEDPHEKGMVENIEFLKTRLNKLHETCPQRILLKDDSTQTSREDTHNVEYHIPTPSPRSCLNSRIGWSDLFDSIMYTADY